MLSSGTKLDLRLPAASAAPHEWSYEIRFRDSQNLADIVDEVTRSLCMEALRRMKGNRKDAATVLGISRQSLYRYMKTYGLESEYDAVGLTS
jgi:DNA-binding NtrC family response regulator